MNKQILIIMMKASFTDWDPVHSVVGHFPQNLHGQSSPLLDHPVYPNQKLGEAGPKGEDEDRFCNEGAN